MIVAPYAGAWIEIFKTCSNCKFGKWSLPMRERGLKYILRLPCTFHIIVAPYAGAWIEISQRVYNTRQHKVAPYAGAWIEIKI